MNSILVDTSFCIRLLSKNDPLHENAKDYLRHFVEKGIEIYLSSIVVAEYSVKDDANNLPLKLMKIIPFDFFDGKTAGEFHSTLLHRKNELRSVERLVVKDDCKLIAQLYNRKIDGYITKDKKSFTQIIQPLSIERNFRVELLDLAIPINEYRGELF